MNTEPEIPSVNEQFEELANAEDRQPLYDFVNHLNISDVAELMYEYEDYATEIISNMPVHRAASVFKILDIGEQKQIIRELPSHKTAELLNELPPDDRTDFLEELPKAAIRDLIKLLNHDERKITLSMLGYPEDSVGRLMTPDYVYVYRDNTVEQVFTTIRKVAKNSETIDVIYVINEAGELVDDLRIRDLILAAPSKRIDEIIDGRVVALNVHDDQEHASQIFKMNNRVALPVTDDNNVLMGIVTIDDILWVANEEYSEDMQKIGGTEAFTEPYLDINFFKLIRKRVGWLVVLFFSEMLTYSAMANFESELIPVLTLFLPLIASSGGNSGSQASTLIIQAMSIGEVTVQDWWRVMRRELLSGLTLGTILGAIGFSRVILWHFLMSHGIIKDLYGPHYFLIALTIGFSVLGIVLWGTFAGAMLPIVLKKLGADPAASSAPFVATLVDVTGIVIYFTVASVILSGVLL